MQLPNIGYHAAIWEGHCRRKIYRYLLPAIVRRPVKVSRQIPFAVFAYSGEASLPEQVLSIRSFLRHAGRPTNFTVVSDGSYTSESIELLKSIDSIVQVHPVTDYLPDCLPPKVDQFIKNHPLGRQLGLIMSLPLDGEPALYIDSDVLFFQGASHLPETLTTRGASALYLPDCREESADFRLLRDSSEKRNPVNTGLLFLCQKLDWSLAIQRYLELKGEPTFFTNQTMTHLTMHANHARPLDARIFVLQLDDQCVYADRYANKNLVLRHYVNPVRHKLWNTLLR
jgi:hypothetical protein